jgi:cytochrome c oxidase assembly factor CtaG
MDHALLTFHMVQHLLLMTVAAPLILLGMPRAVLARGAPRSARGPLVAFCWLAGTVVVVAWHVPAALELGMRSHAWHLLQHATFFVAGLLFWWPVVGAGQEGPGAALPRSLVPLYLFLATLPCDALSAFLAFCGRVVYPSHQAGHTCFGLSPLQDQECAGALMWFWVTIAYLLPALASTLRLLSPSRGERVMPASTGALTGPAAGTCRGSP